MLILNLQGKKIKLGMSTARDVNKVVLRYECYKQYIEYATEKDGPSPQIILPKRLLTPQATEDSTYTQADHCMRSVIANSKASF